MGKMLKFGVDIIDSIDVPSFGVSSLDAANNEIFTDNLLPINSDAVDAIAEFELRCERGLGH